MSVLPEYKVPPDYRASNSFTPSWVATHSKKILQVGGASPEALQTIAIVNIGAAAFEYTQGESSSPLQENRFTRIKGSLNKMRTEGFKSMAIIRVIAQSVSIVQAYTSLYNLVSQNPISSMLPFEGGLAPLANLVLKGDTLLDNIEAWEASKGTDSEQENLVKVIGSVASCLLYSTQFFAFLAITKVSIGLQGFLSTVLSLTTLYDLISKEYERSSSFKDQIEKPPKISMMV